MNADETAAALAYANGIDGRVTITPARHDLWATKLAQLPAGAVRAAILDYYDEPLPAGAREQTPIATRDIKRLASRWRAKCPDHPGRPADRCYECGLEIENGDRPAGAMGVARPPMKNLESNRGRLRALLGGKS